MRRLVAARASCRHRLALEVLRSANEVVSTLRKAGRGAGLDDASARDIARAAVRALVRGEPGLRDALHAFEEPERARALIAAADLQVAGEAAGPEDEFHTLLPHLTALLGDPAAALPPGPVEVDDALWSALDRLAARTYVAATEGSRLAGAGAGTTDND